jgi:predicted RNA binding protein YcfA (HicA-like mRNA interferase family)
MPRLNCTFAQFIEIIEREGFLLLRQEGSHRRYRGEIGGQVRLVTVAYHRITDTVRTGTLDSMIRQSGLPKSMFRS